MADKLADTGTRMGEHGRALKDEAAATIADGKSVVGAYTAQAKQYAQQGYKYAVDKSKVAKDKTEGFIQENPWYAVGIALGVGVLVGMLLRRGGNSD